MKVKLVKYDHQHTFMFPTGKLATPAVMEREYPACKSFDFIVTTDEQMQTCYSFQNMASMRGFYGIDPARTDEEALAELEEIMNAPPEEPAALPTAEERIAAALEYQNLVSM